MKKLKVILQKDLDDSKHKLLDSELIDIVEKINFIPEKERTEVEVNSIVKSVLDIESVSLSDLSVKMLISDNSDIDNLLDKNR